MNLNSTRGNMLYKHLVFIIIALSDLYIAFSIRKYGTDKIKFHITLLDFITYARQQIVFFCAPTNKIINGYGDRLLRDSGFFDDGGIDGNIYLDTRGKKLMNDFFGKFGKSSVEDQVANCDYTIDGINNLLDEYKNDIQKKYKAYSILTVILGAMVIVLLI